MIIQSPTLGSVDLETFLGGMETRAGAAWVPGERALETFLGGMETEFGAMAE